MVTKSTFNVGPIILIVLALNLMCWGSDDAVETEVQAEQSLGEALLTIAAAFSNRSRLASPIINSTLPVGREAARPGLAVRSTATRINAAR